jgi:hypothetical protein
MTTWKGIVGASFTPATFEQYCHSLHWLQWRPRFVALHNTEIPTLADRPQGLTRQHILDLEHYYRFDVRPGPWNAGPHLFIDDRQIRVFTPLTVSGVHSPCFNKVALGVEMLGNYDKEEFASGRGRQVRDNTVAALATLHAVLGLDPATLKLHKEDTCSTHRDCPGRNVHKAAIIQAVQDLLQERHPGDHLPPPES